MTTLGWVGWGFTLFVSLLGLKAAIRARTASGVPQMATPAGWAWLASLGALGIILLADWNPWHFLWMIPVGSFACALVGRALVLLGLLRL